MKRHLFWKDGQFYGAARAVIRELREMGATGKLFFSRVEYGLQPPFGKGFCATVKDQEEITRQSQRAANQTNINKGTQNEKDRKRD